MQRVGTHSFRPPWSRLPCSIEGIGHVWYPRTWVLARILGALQLTLLLTVAIVLAIIKHIVVLPRNAVRWLLSADYRSEKKRTVTGVDATWLVESPANPMVITACMFLDGEADVGRVRTALRERFVKAYSSLQRTVLRAQHGLASPVWVSADDFDFDQLITLERLRAPTDEALRARVEELMGSDLPRDTPLWRFHIMTNGPDGHTVLVLRIHHALGDGSAFMQAMWAMTDDAMGAPGAPMYSLRPSMAPRPGGALLKARTIGGLVLRVVPALLGLLTLHFDDPNPLKGTPRGQKRIAYSSPMPLAELKTVARQLGVTLNDLLIGAMASALSHYLDDHANERARTRMLRAVVPFDMRDPRAVVGRDDLDNKFGLVFLELPVAPMETAERVRETSRRMSAVKLSPQRYINYLLMLAVGNLPGLGYRLASHFCSRSTMVFTNVVGPAMARTFGGAALHGMVFFVPQAGGLTSGFSIFSYAGKVTIGITTDAAVCPHPEAIIPYFERSLSSLASASTTSSGSGNRPAVALENTSVSPQRTSN